MYEFFSRMEWNDASSSSLRSSSLVHWIIPNLDQISNDSTLMQWLRCRMMIFRLFVCWFVVLSLFKWLKMRIETAVLWRWYQMCRLHFVFFFIAVVLCFEIETILPNNCLELRWKCRWNRVDVPSTCYGNINRQQWP